MEFLDETLEFFSCHSAPKRVESRLLLIAASCAVLAAPAALYMDAPKQQTRAEILWTRPICVETNR